MKTIEEVENAARVALGSIDAWEGMAKAAEVIAEGDRGRGREIGKRFHAEAVEVANMNIETPIIVDVDGVHYWFHPDGRVTTPGEKEGG